MVTVQVGLGEHGALVHMVVALPSVTIIYIYIYIYIYMGLGFRV